MLIVTKGISLSAIGKLLAVLFVPPTLGALAVGATIDVGGLETNIVAIATLISFSIPLIAGTITLGIRYLYNVEKAWKEAQAGRLAAQDVGVQVNANTEAIQHIAERLGISSLPTNPPTPHIDTGGTNSNPE